MSTATFAEFAERVDYSLLEALTLILQRQRMGRTTALARCSPATTCR